MKTLKYISAKAQLPLFSAKLLAAQAAIED